MVKSLADQPDQESENDGEEQLLEIVAADSYQADAKQLQSMSGTNDLNELMHPCQRPELSPLAPLDTELRQRAGQRCIHGSHFLVGEFLTKAGLGAPPRLFGLGLVDAVRRHGQVGQH